MQPGPASETGDLTAQNACAGETDAADCATAVAQMGAWLSAHTILQK